MTLAPILHVPLWLALLGLETASAPTIGPLRLIDTPHLHVGLRPAGANEGAAITVQITGGWL